MACKAAIINLLRIKSLVENKYLYIKVYETYRWSFNMIFKYEKWGINKNKIF